MNELFKFLFESSVCLIIFYIVYLAFLQKETFFKLNRFFLISSILASVIIPAVRISSPIGIYKANTISSYYSLESTPIVPVRSIGIWDVLLFFYLAGVFIFFIKFCFQLFSLVRLTRNVGIQRVNGTRIVLLDRDCSTFSFFNLVYVAKSNFDFNGVEEILEHEMVHVKQLHSVDIILLELFSIFQWFNPFVWPYKKSLKETHEYLADQGVIEQGCSLAKYQLLIVEQHVGGKLLEFASNFKNSQIKRRITMLAKKESKGLSKLKFLLVLPLAVLLVLIFAESPAYSGNDGGGVFDQPILSSTPGSSGDIQSDQKKKELEMKKKEQMKQLEMDKIKVEKLSQMLETETDPAKQKKIKQAIEEIKAKYSAPPKSNGPNGDALVKELKLLEKKIKTTDDPDLKAKLKEKYIALRTELDKVKQSAPKSNGPNGDALVKELKMLEKKIKTTDDPDVKAKLKQKYVELMNKLEKEKQLALKEKKKK